MAGFLTVNITNSMSSIRDIITDAEIDRLVYQLALVARAELVKQAKMNLRSSQQDYIQAISDVVGGNGTYSVFLDPQSWMANSIESGLPPFDMKAGLLAGPNAAKYNHKKNVIPFLHKLGGNYSVNVQSGEEIARGFMPKEVSAVAKKMKFGERIDSNSISAGAIPKQIVGYHRQPQAGNYTWRGIYGGMLKGGQPRHSQYVTFRTITETSSGWQHPGIYPHNFMKIATDVALSKVELMVQKIALKYGV